jgi:hypothetical protein
MTLNTDNEGMDDGEEDEIDDDEEEEEESEDDNEDNDEEEEIEAVIIMEKFIRNFHNGDYEVPLIQVLTSISTMPIFVKRALCVCQK